MGLKTQLRQRFGQFGDARSQAASLGIGCIWSLKTQRNKNGVFRRDANPACSVRHCAAPLPSSTETDIRCSGGFFQPPPTTARRYPACEALKARAAVILIVPRPVRAGGHPYAGFFPGFFETNG